MLRNQPRVNFKENRMKKVIFGLVALSITFSAFADRDCRNGVDHKHPSCYSNYNYRHAHRPTVIVQNRPDVWDVAVPVIIGGVIGYAISNNQQRQVVEQQTNPNCGPWIETQTSDGAITRTRTCNR